MSIHLAGISCIRFPYLHQPKSLVGILSWEIFGSKLHPDTCSKFTYNVKPLIVGNRYFGNKIVGKILSEIQAKLRNRENSSDGAGAVAKTDIRPSSIFSLGR